MYMLSVLIMYVFTVYYIEKNICLLFEQTLETLAYYYVLVYIESY